MAQTRSSMRAAQKAKNIFALRGQCFSYSADPFDHAPDDAAHFESDGAVIIEDDKILELGPAGETLAKYPDIQVTDYKDHLIMAGFIDCHVHYPQTEIIASYGEQLLTWLNKYTFPAELKYSNYEYASAQAHFFLDECLRNGITSASVYCTSHPNSVSAFFEAAQQRNFCMAAGKVMMDRNAPDALCDTAEQGYIQSKKLLADWHGADRLIYAITPRFAPTSTPQQLEAAGALRREHPSALMQTHISENHAEIAWVKELYPDCEDYLSVYEKYGLIGKGANFGHALHLTPREKAALHETGSGISHCPTSNNFIGSGLFPMGDLRASTRSIPVGLATDIGGGSAFSMLATMKASYEICQLQGFNLHPAKAYYLATLGSAHVMGLEQKIGNLAPGYDADIIVLDPAARPLLAERMRRADNFWDMLFILMILGDDRSICATYIAGQQAYSKER